MVLPLDQVCMGVWGSVVKVDTCDRLRQRLGVEEEDADVEEIISCLLKQEEILAMEMFRYGRRYQQKQND